MGYTTLSETFTSIELDNYDTIAANVAFIEGQRHVDIRTFVPSNDEAWTSGTTSYASTLNYWPVLTKSLSTGTNTFSSAPTHPIDILTGFADTDIVSLILPSFPLASVTTSSSFIDFSDSTSFTNVVSVAFSASTTTLVSGNSRFTFNRSTINTGAINLASIQGVRFRIQATGAATLTLMALRLLASTWTAPNMDFDNYNHRFRSCPYL